MCTGFVGQIPMEFSRLTRLVKLDLSSSWNLRIENPNLFTLFRNLSGLTDLYLDFVNISANGYEWGQVISSSLPNLRVLSLRGCLLSGPIDSSLQNLQYLSEIDLSANNLSSPVPDFFANFANLTVLILSDSGLYGTFPDIIFQRVQTLETLDLSGNELNGSLPDFPQNRPLRNLVLSSTSFSGNLPESIGNLMELQTIDISWGHFSGPIPNSLANLIQLVSLDFGFNNFTGPIPSFQRSKDLTSISFYRNALTGPVPSIYFEGLSNLEGIILAYNSFNGSIPSSLFSLPSLRSIELSNNQFSNEVSGFLPNGSLSTLDTLDLSHNKLQGPIPSYFFDFQSLVILDLSSNNFSGTIQLESIHRLQNLTHLDFSYNSLSVNASISNSSLSSFPQLNTLGLASCNLQKFPPLMNQSQLFYLDLSDNHISGVIPNWIWNLARGFPTNQFVGSLNLSCNFLVGLQSEYLIPTSLFHVIDLHSNQLHGEIPIPPESAFYVDYSRNNFSSSLSADIGNAIASAEFFFISDNMLSGPIPPSICNGSNLDIINLSNNRLIGRNLDIIDLSNNRLTGTIPQCLIDKGTTTLGVLNLQNNNLTGNITGTFPKGCGLRTLDLNGNLFEGQVPKSLANCADMEVLNLGTNNMNGNFPCFLTNLSNLRVLVLRSNKFHGSIHCREIDNTIWPKLQIIDLALNNFKGILPSKFFSQRKAMIDVGNSQPNLNYLRFGSTYGDNYYEYSVTVMNKGLEMKLVKILTIFTTIDFSNNNFTGEIPDTVGVLKSLYVLNLSHNSLTGSIPSSVGNLTQLGSLDLSWNKLSGSIPETLARLTFLSFLNLSYNQLVGMIPRGPQLQTFLETSFIGNKGLWGAPLTACCKEVDPTTPTLDGRQSNTDEDGINWVYITATLGYTVGFGVIVVPLLYSKRWRQCYYKPLDRVIVRILHHQEQRAASSEQGIKEEETT